MAGLKDISWSLIAYILFCIIVSLTVCMKLVNINRALSAVLALILFILIFVFFGLRWFRKGASVFSYEGPWPPLINTCPDYLVYYNNGGKDSCIDLIGISQNGNLKPWREGDNPKNPPPESSGKYFPYVYKPGMTIAQLGVLCENTRAMGLTWEGITNGESCYDFSSQTTVVAPDGTVSKCPPPPSK
jgi:hypothetical protein